MLDDKTALVIERDNGAGSSDKACPDPKAPTADCFATPAKLKRIYKIEMGRNAWARRCARSASST